MYTLETEQLIMRLPERADIDAFAALWADPEMLINLPFDPLTRAECWPRFLRNAGSWAILGYGSWLVFEKSGGFVGTAGFFDAARGLGPDFDNYREAGWVFTPSSSGKGIATEAMKAALGWMDGQDFGNQTVCMTGTDHVASIKVAEKCGYSLLREAIDEDGAVRLMIREKSTPN